MIANQPQNIEVVIHPLVLLSAADHYYRVAKDTKKRVVGVLLGTKDRNVIDITNSFAVPFEEDLKNPSVWFLDHNFLETMFWMFKKVNSKLLVLSFLKP
jgi:26S proteasome regulatory subunit N8